MARQSDRLEWEAEQARNELAASLNQLRSRLSPGQIVDETISYVRETPVADFGRNLVRDLREHPLPLLVIFAGITWAITASALSDRKSAQVSAAKDSEPVPVPPASAPASGKNSMVETAHATRPKWEVTPINETIE